MIVPISPLSYTSVAPAHAATQAQVVIGGMSTSYPYKFTAAKFNVSGYSGSYKLSAIDGKTTTDYLDINLSQIATAGWPAGQFNLTASTNSFLTGSPVGTVFAAYIPVSEVKLTVHSDHGPLSGFYNYTYNGETFYLGNNSVIAPIAYNVPGGSYYIKAVFGSNFIYASYAQEIVLPGIKVSGVVHPNEGPAGSTITVNGSGFSANGLVNLTWTYSVLGKSVTQFMTFTANSLGAFTQTVTAPELKLETPAPKGYSTGTVSFLANDTVRALLSNTATWTELPREFTAIYVYNPSMNRYSPNLGPAYNGTLTKVPFYETEPINVTGNYFVPNSQVKLYFDGSLLATATTNGTGYFTVSENVPIVAAGTYTVNATDPLAYIYFSGKTVPEVVVTPNKVVPGQSITVNGYAYTKNSMVNATILGLELHENNVSILTNGMNVPTNSLGEWSFSSTVPMKIYGGTHYINATDAKGVTAYAKITVNPLIALSPSTAALGSNVKVNLYGLSVGNETWTSPKVNTGANETAYGIDYDNALTYLYTGIHGNNYGEYSTSISAVGYPMLHAVQLVSGSKAPKTLESTAWLNVTGTTNTEAQTTAAIKSLNTTVSSLPAQISSSLSSFESSISSQLSSISSAVSSLQSSVSSISSAVSSLQSSVSSISSTLSSIQSSLSSLSSTSSQLSSISSSISSLMTYILVVAVLAIIIIIIQLIMLVRKKY
jgi:hypothetical protein